MSTKDGPIRFVPMPFKLNSLSLPYGGKEDARMTYIGHQAVENRARVHPHSYPDLHFDRFVLYQSSNCSKEMRPSSLVIHFISHLLAIRLVGKIYDNGRR